MKLVKYLSDKIYRISPPILTRAYYALKGDAYSYGKVPLVEAMDKAFDIFLPNDTDRTKYSKDIVRCYVLYGITPADYFLFGFNTINTKHSQRKSFVSDSLKDKTLIKKEGWNNYLELSDKFGFYNKMKPFYHRDIIKLTSTTNRDVFISFAKRNKFLFIKPNSDSYGKGAQVFDFVDEVQTELFFDELIKDGKDWIVETRIFQSDEMAKWNQSAVNTVRLNSYLTKKGFHVMGSFFRTGRKGSIVDNGGSGGIFCSIDDTNGIIITNGRDELGFEYEKHPDSNVKYKGSKIPKWKELLLVAEQAHRTIPHHIYVSWDFALTDQGWVLIEGNWGQFLQQICTKKGLKKQFLEYMNEGKLV